VKLEEKYLAASKERSETIASCVRESVSKYLDDLDGEDIEGLYELVLAQVERPLIEIAMERCMQNQSKASKLLGINRNTLRKKLACYQIK